MSPSKASFDFMTPYQSTSDDRSTNFNIFKEFGKLINKETVPAEPGLSVQQLLFAQILANHCMNNDEAEESVEKGFLESKPQLSMVTSTELNPFSNPATFSLAKPSFSIASLLGSANKLPDFYLP
ncbi:unnamed protein product [Bursaphelenchus okinawaensis]|uniref:Uncharacterized protein n=1 Tax=Bursaphelenchus okinawaensis TaxID=465554 RepID=A0A811K8S2_9BILA|nr:unnamed protein product [Bursaphelenchus okinawaensis]CAG9096553.1 unnamed protein product [Bursaphelenchus okinawaensis]